MCSFTVPTLTSAPCNAVCSSRIEARRVTRWRSLARKVQRNYFRHLDSRSYHHQRCLYTDTYPLCNSSHFKMADDTRQSPEDLSRQALTVNPENKPFTGTQWQNGKAVPYTAPPPQSANMLAGGTEHTAGGKVPEVSLENAFQSGLKWSDFTDLPKRPCVRDALLTGIGGGFALGGFRVIFGGANIITCAS